MPPGYTRRGKQGHFYGEVLNAKEISKALRSLGSDPELTRELRQANKQAASIVAEEAARRIPVGTAPKRGKRLSQTARAAASRTSARVTVGGKRQYYAWMRHRGYRPGGGTTVVEGVPFLRQAVSAKFSEFWAFYEAAINRVTDKFNRKYGLPPAEFNKIVRQERRRAYQQGQRGRDVTVVANRRARRQVGR